MFEIILLGLNHKSAPIEIRECIAFAVDEVGEALKLLKKQHSIRESLLISTCNRIEFLIITSNVVETVEKVKQFISNFKKIKVSKFEQSLYCHVGDDAIRHIFRVASSLDSMVMGEPQILGQIKEAYKISTFEESSGVVLNKLLHKTFFVAKRVRTETGIGDNAVSISYAAVELAKKIFGSLEGKNIMLIGAGEMAELAVEHLIRNHMGKIFVANRTFERSIDLAGKFYGEAISFKEREDYLNCVDIVISSTGATNFVIDKGQVKRAMKNRRNTSLFFIDIAVPRDIDPEINDIENAYVYDIDDLKEIVDENKEDRVREAIKAERIIDEALVQFRRWYDTLDVIPTIIAMRSKIEKIAEKEFEKTFKTLKYLSTSDKEAVARMLDAVVNKILHDPTLFLKNGDCRGDRSFYLDFTRKFFNLC